jgi:3-dehydroquinate synthetase
MFIGVRIHHANDIESQALYGANHGYAFAAGMVSQSASCSTRVRRDGSYIMQMKSSCITLPNQEGHDFFIFFLLSAPN